MADDFAADQKVVSKEGVSTAYFEDYIFQLGRSIGVGTPASASAEGDKGTILADGDFIYVCVETDTWLRTAIATW